MTNTYYTTCETCGRVKARSRARHCVLCGHALIRETLLAYHADIDEMAVERLLAGSPVRSTRGERQEAVASLLRHGLSVRQMAERLRVSRRTVNRLKRNIKVAA